jgi:Fe-S cluster assembly scaffold protein SufB
VILGKKVKAKMSPKLDVYSQNVQATHWVSIDKINPEKKFYIESKGLSNKEAIELSIHGYIQYILENFDTISDSEKNEIENTILSNIQIDD